MIGVRRRAGHGLRGLLQFSRSGRHQPDQAADGGIEPVGEPDQGLPLLLLAAAFGLSAMPRLGAALSLIAAVSQVAGMLVERWLFFAEAKHTVTLYYGR